MPRPLSYPRHLRLVHKRDFERVYRDGLRARGATLLIVGSPNGLPHSRLGLSVGKAIWKGAVERNRVRRIFRESFRLSQHDLPPGLDLILIPARPKLEPELAATCAELIVLAGKIARNEARPPRPREDRPARRHKPRAKPPPTPPQQQQQHTPPPPPGEPPRAREGDPRA